MQASAVGNHDLDQGTEAFAALIAPSSEIDEDSGETRDYSGASFPWLSANLDFTTDTSLAPLAVEAGSTASTAADKVTASVTIDVDGETIGVVGATTPSLASITSTGGITIVPGDATDIEALAAEIQTAADALVEQGADKIVLLAHMQQIGVEQSLATRLEDVDIIVAGGSNTLLADAAGDDGNVTDTVVAGGAVVGDPSRTFRVVILDFIAKCVGTSDEECGDGYLLKGLAAPDRLDPDVDPGELDFAEAGSEQDALAEYLAAFFADTPFDSAETPAETDLRMRDLSRRGDSPVTP